MNQLVTVKQLAEILHVPTSWIYQQTRLGPKAIPFVKIGKYVRFDQDEVIEFFRKKGRLPSLNQTAPQEAAKSIKGQEVKVGQHKVVVTVGPSENLSLDALEDKISGLVSEAIYSYLLRNGMPGQQSPNLPS